MLRLRLLPPTVLALLLTAAPAHAQRGHDPYPDPGDAPALQLPAGAAPSWLPHLPEVPALPAVPATTLPVVPGTVARLRTDGTAAIPHDAPARVRALIRAANGIIGRPYRWGGGHARVVDTGYDCSGAVSYALIRSGQLAAPLVSGELARTYVAGRGRWITIYANAGHVYLEVAGLRLDTSSVGDPAGRSGVRWRPVIGQRAGFRVRHPAGL